MFTGLVEARGVIAGLERGAGTVRLSFLAPSVREGLTLGDSVAVNGVCLTATEVADGLLGFDAVPETLRRTSLGQLGPAVRVNVEPPLRAGEPLGGHLVQGHVDGIGTVRSLAPEGDGMRLVVEAPPEILRYCVEKGSIAVEGVSLTVAALGEDALEIALVPHTLAATTLGSLRAGDPVNLEVDVLAKYVEKLLLSRLQA